METTFMCMKYNQAVDRDKEPCPHPSDYCRYRNSCVINRLCTEDRQCREKKKAAQGGRLPEVEREDL